MDEWIEGAMWVWCIGMVFTLAMCVSSDGFVYFDDNRTRCEKLLLCVFAWPFFVWGIE